ncbi:MAG: methionine biosynthesis protein MetW [Propionibacteriaceae bacterium]|nr:methionine biosynthesis protein MetW [Propionibacteriaceae bacterium]
MDARGAVVTPVGVAAGPKALREDLQILADLVPDGSRVLDLGCHDGDLLSHLIARRNCTGTGVEIDPSAVLSVIRRGIPLVELDIDFQLDEFDDDSYDVVVLSRTIQVIRRPQEVLEQIARIGSRIIVSVPNFAWWGHRLRLLRGRMPMSKELPYKWYNTPNLRFVSLADIELFFAGLGLKIERRIPMGIDGEALRHPFGANLFAGAATYVLGKR